MNAGCIERNEETYSAEAIAISKAPFDEWLREEVLEYRSE